ncbi:MAG: hypothetical protein N2117_06345 [Anaerolineales bacterium]|nr:hypothetical protein [Anaerolineales bacterium]MCX7754851.1 hypothetical protein [Anaerolineales bacterium]MDW8278721.1 hypothetical protein [Anaerolineales bacterium]
MSAALHLYRLQQIDTRLDQLNARLVAIRNALEHDADLQAARRSQQEAEGRLKEAERALGEAERESAAQRIKLEQAEASLYSGKIHNPKELTDLQNDVAALKRRLSALEDHQLEAMLALEEARAALEAAQKAYLVTQGQVISKNAALKTEQDALEKEREALLAQRLAVVPAVPAAFLAQYETLRQQKRGVAVTALSDDACNACGAVITRAHAQTARHAQQLVNCPSCGRILFAG